MFERLLIRNFQKHINLEICFDPHITVLVGPTDIGKSAILRALRWVMFNRAPKNHINFGAKVTKVILYVDGHKIIRKQGEGVNIYSVDGKVLKAFNRNVPDEVQKILNTDLVNFQRQLDPLFWVSLPPPQLSKELNKIVDLSLIDRSLSKASITVKKAKSKAEVLKERLSLLKEQKEELSWVEDVNTQLNSLIDKQRKVESITAQSSELASLIDSLTLIQSSIKSDARFVQWGEDVISKCEELYDVTAKVDLLQNLVDNIEEAKALALLEVPDLSELEGVVSQIIPLEDLLTQIDKERGELCQIKEELTKESLRLSSLRKKLKTCPVCERPIQ